MLNLIQFYKKISPSHTTDLGLLEVKWNNSANSLWRELNNNHLLKANLLKVVIDEFDIKPIFSGVCYSRWNDTKEKAIEYTFKTVFEILHEMAKSVNQPVMIVADADDGERTQLERIKKSFELISQGTEYVSLNLLYKHLWMANSAWHPGIQLADLVAGITSEVYCGGSTYANEAFNVSLKRKFFVNESLPRRHPQRWGLKVLPTDGLVRFVERIEAYPLGLF